MRKDDIRVPAPIARRNFGRLRRNRISTHETRISKSMLTKTCIQCAVLPDLGAREEAENTKPVLYNDDNDTVVGLLDEILPGERDCSALDVSTKGI